MSGGCSEIVPPLICCDAAASLPARRYLLELPWELRRMPRFLAEQSIERPHPAVWSDAKHGSAVRSCGSELLTSC